MNAYTKDRGASASGGIPGVRSGFLWLVLAVLAAIPFFWPGMVHLWAAWQAPEYSHGPLIPIISGYLFLRQLKTVPPRPAGSDENINRWPGAILLAAALLLGLAGNIIHIDGIVALALILWTGGLILTSFGSARGWQFWPPVLHLAFMLPLPYFIQWQATIALQGVSSELGVVLIRSMGIPVFLDGHIIDLGTWKLHVAEACSGLRYLFPIMSFTYLFAVLYQGSVWHKAVLLLAAIPIAIAMNAVRVGIIGIIVDSHGIEHAEGFMHFFEGWAVFITCILLMLGLARLMQRLSGDRRSLAEVLDLDFSGLGGQIARAGDIRPSPQLLGLSLMFALSAGAVAALASTPDGRATRDPFLLFPRTLGSWEGLMNADLSRDIAETLGADDYLSMNFSSPGHGTDADLFVAWYRDQSKGGIHSPEVCIPAGGWEMSAIETSEIVVETGGRGVTVPVNRAVIQKGLDRQLVYYWFDQAGRRLASDYAAKLWLVWDAYDRGRTDGALVRLITPILPGEVEADADARLQALMAEVLPELPPFISAAAERAASGGSGFFALSRFHETPVRPGVL